MDIALRRHVMKEINVVAALLIVEDKVLIAKRIKGEFADLWEFPGGKVEVGESEQDALIREIQEEMEIEIAVKDLLIRIKHQYETFSLNMSCYICDIIAGEIQLNDHSDIKWIKCDETNIEWVPADIQVIESLREYMGI